MNACRQAGSQAGRQTVTARTARHGARTARHVMARHGTARHGTARHGKHGTARPGTPGAARHRIAPYRTAPHRTAPTTQSGRQEGSASRHAASHQASTRTKGPTLLPPSTASKAVTQELNGWPQHTLSYALGGSFSCSMTCVHFFFSFRSPTIGPIVTPTVNFAYVRQVIQQVISAPHVF